MLESKNCIGPALQQEERPLALHIQLKSSEVEPFRSIKAQKQLHLRDPGTVARWQPGPPVLRAQGRRLWQQRQSTKHLGLYISHWRKKASHSQPRQWPQSQAQSTEHDLAWQADRHREFLRQSASVGHSDLECALYRPTAGVQTKEKCVKRFPVRYCHWGSQKFAEQIDTGPRWLPLW